MKSSGTFGSFMGLLALHFRAYCHETEDPEKVLQAFSFVTGEDADVATEQSEGHHGNRILVLEAHLKTKREVKEFFARLSDDDLRELLRTLESRVDEEGNLFMRFDKQEAFKGVLRMGAHEDPIAVRGKIESYPRNHENDLASARAFLEQLLSKRIN
jgi:RNA binding exosome subunit